MKAQNSDRSRLVMVASVVAIGLGALYLGIAPYLKRSQPLKSPGHTAETSVAPGLDLDLQNLGRGAVSGSNRLPQERGDSTLGFDFTPEDGRLMAELPPGHGLAEPMAWVLFDALDSEDSEQAGRATHLGALWNGKMLRALDGGGLLARDSAEKKATWFLHWVLTAARAFQLQGYAWNQTDQPESAIAQAWPNGSLDSKATAGWARAKLDRLLVAPAIRGADWALPSGFKPGPDLNRVISLAQWNPGEPFAIDQSQGVWICAAGRAWKRLQSWDELESGLVGGSITADALDDAGELTCRVDASLVQGDAEARAVSPAETFLGIRRLAAGDQDWVPVMFTVLDRFGEVQLPMLAFGTYMLELWTESQAGLKQAALSNPIVLNADKPSSLLQLRPAAPQNEGESAFRGQFSIPPGLPVPTVLYPGSAQVRPWPLPRPGANCWVRLQPLGGRTYSFEGSGSWGVHLLTIPFAGIKQEIILGPEPSRDLGLVQLETCTLQIRLTDSDTGLEIPGGEVRFNALEPTEPPTDTGWHPAGSSVVRLAGLCSGSARAEGYEVLGFEVELGPGPQTRSLALQRQRSVVVQSQIEPGLQLPDLDALLVFDEQGYGLRVEASALKLRADGVVLEFEVRAGSPSGEFPGTLPVATMVLLPSTKFPAGRIFRLDGLVASASSPRQLR